MPGSPKFKSVHPLDPDFHLQVLSWLLTTVSFREVLEARQSFKYFIEVTIFNTPNSLS